MKWTLLCSFAIPVWQLDFHVFLSVVRLVMGDQIYWCWIEGFCFERVEGAEYLCLRSCSVDMSGKWVMRRWMIYVALVCIAQGGLWNVEVCSDGSVPLLSLLVLEFEYRSLLALVLKFSFFCWNNFYYRQWNNGVLSVWICFFLWILQY